MPLQSKDSMSLEQVDEWIRKTDPRFFERIETCYTIAKIVPSMDLFAQIVVIREFLADIRGKQQKRNEEEAQLEVDSRQATGIGQEAAISELNYMTLQGCYEDAVHCLAAVMVFTPLIETLFRRVFAGIRDAYFGSTLPNSHDRWNFCDKKKWDIAWIWAGGKEHTKGKPEGILQLAEAVELMPLLPEHLDWSLSALFAYRNKIAHNGLEWPKKERDSFNTRREQWPNKWFAEATKSGSSWIIYVTNDFIAQLQTTLDDVLVAISEYVKQRDVVLGKGAG